MVFVCREGQYMPLQISYNAKVEHIVAMATGTISKAV